MKCLKRDERRSKQRCDAEPDREIAVTIIEYILDSHIGTVLDTR